jgi:TonB-linked SusC/RagA family outer membrane protein
MNISFSNRQGSGRSELLGGLQMSPLLPVYDDEGNYTGSYVPAANVGTSQNPVAILERAADNYRKSVRIFGDVYAEVDLMDGLTFKTSAGADIQSLDDRQFLPLNPEHAEARSVSALTEEDFFRYEWIWNNTLNYNKSFGEHNLNALVGLEALRGGQKGKTVSRTNYLFETPDYYLLTNGAGAPIFNNSYDGSSSLFSIFGTANYSYNNKYLLTATVRRDKSSRFRGDNQSDVFPSFSAGWVVSNEDFFPEGFVSRLKLFGSWGELGNQTLPVGNPTDNISNLGESLANYSFTGNGSIRTGAYLSQVGNPNLRWETSETTNIGINLGFLNDKLQLTAEYFNIITKDLISQDFSLINTTAIDAAAPYVNLGSFKNTGVDLSLGYQNMTDSGWSYGIQANVSHYKNEVTELISDFVLGRSEFRGGAVTRTQVGQPLSSFYGRVVEGIFGSESEVSGHADQGFATPADGVGRFKYKDVNQDGVITDEDRTFIGSPHPDFVYGINLNVGYKTFDISAFISGSQGNEIYNYNKIYTDMPTFYNTNRSVRVLDAWSPNNLDATIPKPGLAVPNNETQPNSFFVEDGSFLRLKNVQIGYALPKKVIDKLKVENLRFYVQGTNLFTLTDYDGQDPELGPRNGGDNLTISVDDVQYSTAQIFTFGLNLKF